MIENYKKFNTLDNQQFLIYLLEFLSIVKYVDTFKDFKQPHVC